MDVLKPLGPRELRAHPSLSKLTVPAPTESGKANVAQVFGSPVLVNYRLYGHGPIKILWNNGHGASITSWRRQMMDFGLSSPERYTSCFYSYRNYEGSGGSLSWPSPRTGAEDALKLLDHLGWTGEREVHVVGFSMGGYVAQNIALLAAHRLASLMLASTTSCVRDSFDFSKTTSTLMDLVPRSEVGRWERFKGNLFGPEWPHEADEEGLFPTNGDRMIAEEILNSDSSASKGAVLQMPGSFMHKMSAPELADIGQRVGHHRILVVHGFHDRPFPVRHGSRLHEELGGYTKGVRLYIIKRAAHMAHVEQRKEFKHALDSLIDRVNTEAP